jgi:hypothetical protein
MCKLKEEFVITVTIPPELEADFTAMARTEGLSPEEYLLTDTGA